MPDDTSYLCALDPPSPSVAILLCTYQGDKFLAEQLDSFLLQTHSNWKVWASDAGSTDDTLAILNNYQQVWGEAKLTILHGPVTGATDNFMSLVYNTDIQADYYAFSDQDDIWEADKLRRAMCMLDRNLEPDYQDTPALYCSRTRYVDAHNHELGLSQLFKRPPSFGNALMQNIAGGNTMVFNDSARQLLLCVEKTTPIVIHDWWVYIVVTGCGGTVCYDRYPSLRYRQHSGNLIGMNSSMSARMIRVRMLLQGEFKEWCEKNIAALQQIRDKLTPRNQQTLDQFVQARQTWMLPRLVQLLWTGIYRQTALGNLGLIVAAVFNKL
ncbi:glycosyltransferase family 2 protein [Candidimonas sp. SYP-B2681]|uniref:glycosyltransferase family 2 protein n=1 Tax=Candidimonas sp. SYP-B2681 TaxID=2497686 RepID=UPI000F884EE4|nr:glycosyltransferase family 2 protein [Candidimonas sp. SYP-B2681]RTZ43155.1 glycosyltransferase family 2 protein [Candidimonas sp. SYP-B2681]